MAVRRRSRSRPSESSCLRIFAQLCMALEHVHAHRVVHRDVKTSNAFVTRGNDGRDVVKLGDFGISRVLDSTGDLAATAVARWGLVEGERTAAGALKLTGLGAVAFPLAGGLHLFQFGSGASALGARRPPLQPLIQVVGALLFANAILNAMAGGLLKRRKLIVQG